MTTEAAGLGLTGVLAAAMQADRVAFLRAAAADYDATQAGPGDHAAAWMRGYADAEEDGEPTSHVAEEALTSPEVVEAVTRSLYPREADIAPWGSGDIRLRTARAALAAAAETLGAK
jgi:hypothetical protein